MPTNRALDAALGRWSFLAEAGQRLAESVDCEDTLKIIASLALPRPGDWSIVDLVEGEDAIRRLPVVHPDPKKQVLARRLGAGWPPARDDPLGIPVVQRARAPQIVDPVTDEFLAGIAHDEEHLALLRQLEMSSIISVPLLARDQVLGAITFVGSSPAHHHSVDDHALAVDLAARCALAISHMRRVEELKKSVLLRDQVLGYVSHDLKNPLGAIMLVASQILQEAQKPLHESSPAWRIKAAKTMLAATEQMQRLIGDLLEVALIGAGGVTLERQRVEPSVLMESVRHAYETGLAAQSLRMETVIAPRLSVLLADPNRLRQVFENLLENAAKFTPAGGVVTLGAAPLDGSVLFSVADTGRGISQEEIPRLFDRFWQARQLGAGSAGLGLTICKGIVEAHGGEIWAESTVGEGSTFYFRIPAGG